MKGINSAVRRLQSNKMHHSGRLWKDTEASQLTPRIVADVGGGHKTCEPPVQLFRQLDVRDGSLQKSTRNRILHYCNSHR